MVDTEHQASVPADARPTEVPASATTGGEGPEVLAPPHPVQAPSGVSVPALETATEPIKTDTMLPTAPAEMMLAGVPPASVGIPPESVPGTTGSIAAPADEDTAEVEKAEEVKAGEERADEAKATEAKADEAKADEAKADEAKADEAKADEAKADEAKADEAKADEAKADEAKADEAKADEAKADEAKPDEPKPDEPKADEPKPDEPKPDEPKPDEPKPAEPTPSADAPTKETPSASQPPATATPTQPAAEDGLTHMEMAMPHVKYAQNTIRSLKSRREAAAFLQPVDPIALNIPHYTQIITHPMDLGTIDQKLALTAFHLKGPPGSQNRMSDKLKQAVDSGKINMEQDQYKYVDEFERDVFLVFDNCKRFNGAEHIFTKNAEVLRGVFEKQRKGLPSAVAVANEANANEAKRRSSSALPTIRRSSSNGGRPKREIHPPANRDLPWTEEHLHPASKRAILNRHGKNGQLTPREQAYWSKVINDELKFCVRVIDDLLKPAHQDLAWVFYDIPAKDFDWAPAYYATIKKPIALTPIQRKLKTGGYADLAAFDADMQLMFNNCFTFNPPDSDVYVMGARLKDVYEGKMQKKPVPPPLEPEEEMDVDDDEDDDDDLDPEDANAVLVQQLQRQIAELEGTLETLENSKSKNPVLITSTRVALNSVQAALAGAMSVSGMMGKKGKKRSNADVHGSAKKAKSKGEPKKKAKKASGSPAPRKRSAGSDEEDVRTVTFDQKEELAAKITELTDERLEGAIRILNEDKPPGQQGGEDDEIELDIDELSPQTLYKLYKYVVRPKKKNQPEVGPNGKPTPASAPIDGRKRGTGGLKKKNLDETEEAERIARLQQQLQQFNDPDHTPKPATPAEAEASSKHDDLVQSDSSSGEEESDSDSDMD